MLFPEYAIRWSTITRIGRPWMNKYTFAAFARLERNFQCNITLCKHSIWHSSSWANIFNTVKVNVKHRYHGHLVTAFWQFHQLCISWPWTFALLLSLSRIIGRSGMFNKNTEEKQKVYATRLFNEYLLIQNYIIWNIYQSTLSELTRIITLAHL